METNRASRVSGLPVSGRKSSAVLRNRKKILLAAQEVLGELGPDVQNDAIAARAGVSVSTLYMHFTNRQELVRAALLDALRTWERWVMSHFTSIEPSLENSVLPARLLMRIQETHPVYGRLLQSHLGSTGLLFDELSQGFSDSIRLLVQRGELSDDQIEPRLAAMEGAVYGILGRQLKNPDATAEEADLALELALPILGIAPDKARQLTHSPLPHLSARI